MRRPWLLLAAGFDPDIVARLSVRDHRAFDVVSSACVLAALLAGAGGAYGAWLAFESVVAAALAGVLFLALVLNLYRLLHAGTGFALHRPLEELEAWRPGWPAVVVLFALGALVGQPVLLLLCKPWLHLAVDAPDGIVTRAHALWSMPAPAAVVTVALALLISSPAWLRHGFVVSVRNYERERWIDDRMFVDDAFAFAQDAILHLLTGLPSFAGTLSVHSADPPYDTRPLLFGVDPDSAKERGVRFVKGTAAETHDAIEPAQPVVPATPVTRAPVTPAPVAVPNAQRPTTTTAPTTTPSASPSLPAAPAHHEPVVLHYLDVGRLTGAQARAQLDHVAPFVAELLGRPLEEVKGFLRAAPDDEPVHRLFSAWNSLPVLLMKSAGFALEHGLAPLIAIAVKKPVDDVERRLRAAPPDKRVTGVFVSELARVLLPQGKR